MGRAQTVKWLSEFPVVARIPLLPVEPAAQRGEDLAGPLLEAVSFASRSIGNISSADLAADNQLALTVRAYEQRARNRATPRGAFAGVQVAQSTRSSARLQMGSAHRARSMPSGAWLDDLARQLVETPGVVQRLRLTANSLVTRRGDRFEHEQADDAGAPVLMTLRATPVVALIMRTCKAGATPDEITAAVLDAWNDAPEAKIHETVQQMIRTGHLRTDLLPQNIAQDPLGHILSKLPEASDVGAVLAAIREHLQDADLHPPGAPQRLALLTAARDLCDKIARHTSPITIDVAVDADLEIPASLLDDAAEAIALLWSITPTATTLDDYHARFVERHGIGSRVPLLSVMDPVTGLGETDVDAENHDADRARGRVLAALIARAAATSELEVELDDATIAGLRVLDDGVPPPPTGEVYTRVVSASPEDLQAGRFQLAMYMGCTQDAGSSTGRFASLLPDAAWDLPRTESVLAAEVVVRPRIAKLDTVAPPTDFAQTRICVGVAPRPGDLTLDDLELASDGHRLVLWSRERAQCVTPTLFSRIGPSYIPPVARLLQQLSAAGTRPWYPWSWGPLSAAPFQPRVRWRRTILSPARWRLPQTLIAAASDATAWASELARWRAATVPCLPRVVVAEEADRRLPLDLEDPRDRDLLRRYARRGTDTVTEQPGGPDAIQGVVAGPDGGHLLELVIPLKGRQPTTPARTRPRTTASTNPVIYLPGTEWLSLTLVAPTRLQDEVLTEIAKIAQELRDDIDRWFWLRYDSTAHGPHLRVRFAGDPAVLTTRVLPEVSKRCAQLMTLGVVSNLVVEPYAPEIDRYGGPSSIEAAERVFHADGLLALGVLSSEPNEDQRITEVALSALAIARVLTTADSDAIGRPRLDRSARRHVNSLRATAPAVTAGPLDDTVRDAWDRRALALATYRDVVPESRRTDCASSIIHMHANRVLGDRDRERKARALAAELLAKGRR